ncbi:ABC transporter ATP-binding protein [Natronosalvus amylolyticus]|uniref:ABC transporter ATP-binding protein n=1 Tax=Natronosalvus amylolyticus TaxID=2961994 RepID=UPI0020CA0314|nr:ABC transporter ATP-binding protein [Natronosalvus amylolyticus]
MIEVTDLRKEYGGFTAVEGSSFSIERGEVFGIVGHNGAGKTTTLKMLAGLIEPTGGTAVVAGHPAGAPAMQRRLGFLPEQSPLYEEMTPISYLEFFADLYDVPKSVAAERIDDILDRLDLEHRDRELGNMSKGMKRKVAIARALVNDPDVLIFDEPASGLDPLTTNYILEFTSELTDEGKTVVFSAHNLFHVESICDRLVIMSEGTIVARGTIDDIRSRYGGRTYHVTSTLGANSAAVGPDAVDASVTEYARENGHCRYVVTDMDGVDAVRTAVEAVGGRVTDIETKTPSLEQIFLEVADEATA